MIQDTEREFVLQNFDQIGASLRRVPDPAQRQHFRDQFEALRSKFLALPPEDQTPTSITALLEELHTLARMIMLHGT